MKKVSFSFKTTGTSVDFIIDDADYAGVDKWDDDVLEFVDTAGHEIKVYTDELRYVHSFDYVEPEEP